MVSLGGREATTGKELGPPRKGATTDTPEPTAKVARISETQVAQCEAGLFKRRAKAVRRIDAHTAYSEAGLSEPTEEVRMWFLRLFTFLIGTSLGVSLTRI